MLFNFVPNFALLPLFYLIVSEEAYVDDTCVWCKYEIWILISMIINLCILSQLKDCWFLFYVDTPCILNELKGIAKSFDMFGKSFRQSLPQLIFNINFLEVSSVIFQITLHCLYTTLSFEGLGFVVAEEDKSRKALWTLQICKAVFSFITVFIFYYGKILCL